MSGSAVASARTEEDGGQLRLVSADAWMQAAPGNVQSSDVQNWGRAEKLYTVGCVDAALMIDKNMHQHMLALLTAPDQIALQATLMRLHCWHNPYEGSPAGRLSLSKFIEFSTSIAGVMVLPPAAKGKEKDFTGRCRCTCMWFSISGQCSHEAYVRLLLNDPEVNTTELKSLCKKTPQEPKHSIQPGPKIAVPPGSAWTTLDELLKRADDKKKRASEKKRQASESLATPKKARSDPTPSDRDARLQEIALQLANDKDFKVLFSAVSSLEKLKVTVAEAHKHGLGKSLKKLVDDDRMAPPLRTLADRQVQAWMAVIKTKSQ